MTLSIGQISSLATVGIQKSVADAAFKDNAHLARLRAKQGEFMGTLLQFPFNYYDSTQTNGSFYNGGAALTLDMYDPITSLQFELKEIQETLVITHRDLALNQSKAQRISLLEARLKLMKQAFMERMAKAVASDGTSSTGALSDDQFIGYQAFLKSSAVNYGGVTSSDVSVHVAYVASNSSVNRALTTALDQEVLGGASEGNQKPTVRVMRQNVMNQFVELLKPYQRTTRESSLDGLGHEKNTLVYSGVDSIIDNLSVANSIAYFNEEFVKLYVHPEYDMKIAGKDDLETMDAVLKRVFLKGAYACNVLRYQGWLKDISA